MRFNKGGRFRAECRLYMECKFDSFAPPGFQIFEKTSAAKIKAMKELLSKNRMVDVTPSNGNVCYNNWKAKQVSTRGTQEECEKKCLLDVNCKFMIYNPEGRKDCETLDEECDFKARAGNSVVFKKEPASPEETPEETPEEIPEEKPAPPKKAPGKKPSGPISSGSLSCATSAYENADFSKGAAGTCKGCLVPANTGSGLPLCHYRGDKWAKK